MLEKADVLALIHYWTGTGPDLCEQMLTKRTVQFEKTQSCPVLERNHMATVPCEHIA